MTLARSIEPFAAADLAEKAVLVGGPRQVGKTTLARRILTGRRGAYFDWDNREDRRAIRDAAWPDGEALVALDEIHKSRGWKGWLKGEIDKHRGRLGFLVTGSARLDVYRKAGDSLQGRYRHYRLHPFTAAELDGNGAAPVAGAPLALDAAGRAETVDALLRFGGFPEPCLAGTERAHRRWQKERTDRFFREDVRDLEAVRELAGIEQLAQMLETRVASPLSANSLREDLEASHRAVAHWLEVLDRLYHLFRVPPHAGRLERAVRKMPKAYLWDWSAVPAPGPRFENLIASHLLKLCHFLEDADGRRAELRHLRDKDGREVDFLVVLDRRPWLAVEAKLDDAPPSAALRYYKERLAIPCAYQVALGGRRDALVDGIRCVPAPRFLAGLV